MQLSALEEGLLGMISETVGVKPGGIGRAFLRLGVLFFLENYVKDPRLLMALVKSSHSSNSLEASVNCVQINRLRNFLKSKKN